MNCRKPRLNSGTTGGAVSLPVSQSGQNASDPGGIVAGYRRSPAASTAPVVYQASRVATCSGERHALFWPAEQVAAVKSGRQASGSETSPSATPSAASHWASTVSPISGTTSGVTISLPSAAVLACTSEAMKVATRPV